MNPELETTLDHSDADDPGATLESPAHGPGARLSDGTVLEQLGRFRLERQLGQGGMGQVWEAWDPQLERQVAIKRLLTKDLPARERFLREARLQATILHPGVCPVFEVGQYEGEPYLVMPCFDGARLDEAVDGASLEYKLDLLRQVAQAVHAAHEQGLIHRDLKPANILVESPSDAPARPVVLDFGIARPMEGEGLTASGEIVGTPAYMAPEQVAGKSANLDRRTDIYALGATLYRLLTDRPPHLGEGTPLLFRIMREEPERLPSGEVPAEVEAIVFKCLEKDKNARYDSARALAEDLGRYLAGEPVEARPVTRWIRFGKWMRRHRVAVRATSVASLVALAALAWGGWSAWRSEERQEVARRFGAQVEEIEALARYSHLVPLHDARADQAQLRARLDAIRPSLDDRDPVVRALAAHALGRGHLALDELETARGFLETAYELDPENAEIAADLGRTLSELYRDRLTTLERTRDPGGRESLREQLSSRLESTFGKTSEQQKQWQQALEEPARDLLASGRTSQAPNTIELDALLLFHEGKPEAALDLLANTPPTPAWAYERLSLEGDIRRSWGASMAIAGDPEGEARRRLEEAREAYGQALTVAPSHAALLLDDAQTVTLLIEMRLVPAEEVEPLIGDARESLSRAQEIDPEGLEIWLWTARLEFAAAIHYSHLAQDPGSAFANAFDAAQQAVAINDQSSAAWFELAQTHAGLARWERLQGLDPTARFEQATQAFDRVAPEDRDYVYFIQVGILRLFIARQRSERGLEAANAYQAAIETYRSAAEIHSAPFAALTNLGVTLLTVADLEGTNPRHLLTQASEIFQQAHELRPNSMLPFYYLGLCRLRLAQQGNLSLPIADDAMAELAQGDFEKAIELASDRFQPWVGLGELFHVRAIAAHARGQDPSEFFARARQAFGQALELAPDQPIALLNLAWTTYFEGKFALREGLDPTAQLAEAEDLCRRSLEAQRHSKTLLCLGSVHRLQAEHRLNRNEYEIAASHISDAEAIFKEILELDAKHAEGHRSLGRLITLEASRRRQMDKNPTAALARARSFLDRALELEKSVIDFYLADARWNLEQAEWLRATDRDFSESIAAGRLSLAEAINPSAEIIDLLIDLESFSSMD